MSGWACLGVAAAIAVISYYRGCYVATREISFYWRQERERSEYWFKRYQQLLPYVEDKALADENFNPED